MILFTTERNWAVHRAAEDSRGFLKVRSVVPVLAKAITGNGRGAS